MREGDAGPEGSGEVLPLGGRAPLEAAAGFHVGITLSSRRAGIKSPSRKRLESNGWQRR